MSIEVLDFFSRESKVSLQLPIGWEEMEEGKGYVIYSESLEDDDDGDDNEDGISEESDSPDLETPSHPPKLIIKTFALPAADENAYRKLSAQIINQPRQQQEILSQTIFEVDGLESSIDLFTYWDDLEACKIAQYQVFVQIAEQIVCSITGVTEDSFKEEYLPVFEQAVQSIRFIPI